MAIPILFELNQDLTRLFAAGSRLAAGDPRIKKYVAPLKKYGEKAPVFLKLAQYLEELLEADAASSAPKLIAAESFLLSVLSTQGESAPAAEETVTSIRDNRTGPGSTAASHKTLSPVIEALTAAGGGRMEIIQNAYESGVFKDPRTYKAAVGGLGDKYGEIADYMANTVLPSIDEGISGLLMDGYNIKGGMTDGRRLSVLHKIKGRDMLPIAEEAAENGHAPVKAEAVKIMGDYPEYEETLLGMMGESKTVREEVMKALVKMDSKTGIDKIIDLFKGRKADTVLDTVRYGSGEYLSALLTDIIKTDYEAVKRDGATEKDAERLKMDLSAMQNKAGGEAVPLLKTMLTEEYLTRAEDLIAKEKKTGYYNYTTMQDMALSLLYGSGKCEDYIWYMFMEEQGGLVSKLFKAKTKRGEISRKLCCYAFYIGAKRLDKNEFYNIFFKSNLYKDVIHHEDGHAFRNVFLAGENPPAYSDKIPLYFMSKMKDVHMTVRLVSPSDLDTLNLLADHLRNNLTHKTYSSGNYIALKRLGEVKHPAFNELLETYSGKGLSAEWQTEELQQLLNKA